MEYTFSRVTWFVRTYLGYLAAGTGGLGLGLVIAWVLWPVQWEGAMPADLLAEYKVLITNSVAEDQIYFGQNSLSPGAEKILGYLGPDALQAVNGSLTALRESDELNLAYEPAEKDLVVNNLLFLQTMLAEPPQLTNAGELASTVGPVDIPGTANSNRFVRLFSWISVMVLVGGLGWVSYRIIAPKEEPVAVSVRFNSDLEVEEFDEEEEQPTGDRFR